MRRSGRRAVAALAVAAMALGALAACGDDDGDEDAGATTTSAAGETTEAAEEGVSEEVCTAYGDVSAAFNGEPDPEQVAADLDVLEAEPPEEVAESLTVMTDAARAVLESGGEDFSSFEAPEFGEAQGEVDPYFFASCDYGTEAEVTTVDYGFEGLPSEVEAGRLAVLLTNEGSEPHEMVVVRKADGATESFDELLALPEEEAMAKVEEVGGGFVPAEGAQSLALLDTTPGEYAAICFIPVGTTGPDAPGEGPPHFTEGMKTEFTVTE
ncbi:hypothetical protein PO878_03105 [Iamia majanohamensis]|uniref:Lipoprotein n=1 Tax=Iamia majanohamensis TaxID=467976 RepID=A0AAE9Y8J3_9ACTN|nr:hypothetical protein [Iamia majanohamensis]WCO67711.1 hypothetical protein PO878_03105 [Iamia majanohamensis]